MSQNSRHRFKKIVEIEHTYIPLLSLQLWKAEIFRVKINPQTTWKPSILRSTFRNPSPLNSGLQSNFTRRLTATVADNACCIRLEEHSGMLFVAELVLLYAARPWKQKIKSESNGGKKALIVAWAIDDWISSEINRILTLAILLRRKEIEGKVVHNHPSLADDPKWSECLSVEL